MPEERNQQNQQGGGGPTAELIAKRIIRLAQQGQRDPNRLRERAVEGL